MKLRTIGLSLSLPVLALSAFALSARVGAQDDMLPKPTEHHALLERTVGVWKTSLDMPAYGIEGSPGTVTRRMIGKLWQVDDYEGDMMGMPFHGLGVTGYDTEKKKCVGMWIDSMGDRLTTFEGSYDEASKTLRFDYPGRNPMTGEEQMETHETQLISDDEMVFRMLWPSENGQKQEVMRIRYERKK
jgi:hypothetical protein